VSSVRVWVALAHYPLGNYLGLLNFIRFKPTYM
jgi:hypothetical protein